MLPAWARSTPSKRVQILLRREHLPAACLAGAGIAVRADDVQSGQRIERSRFFHLTMRRGRKSQRRHDTQTRGSSVLDVA